MRQTKGIILKRLRTVLNGARDTSTDEDGAGKLHNGGGEARLPQRQGTRRDRGRETVGHIVCA